MPATQPKLTSYFGFNLNSTHPPSQPNPERNSPSPNLCIVFVSLFSHSHPLISPSDDIPSVSPVAVSGQYDNNAHDIDDGPGPTNISVLLDSFLADPADTLKQSALLNKIIAASMHDTASIDAFNNLTPSPLSLGSLRCLYARKRDHCVLSLLSGCHFISIDNNLHIPVSHHQLYFSTNCTMINYHLTVAKDIRFASILPNSASNHHWQLTLDLHKLTRCFKGKHVQVGFNTKGCLLYIGSAMNEDIFLAMALNSFFYPDFSSLPLGCSSSPSNMSTCHYHQIVMMLIYFLSHIPDRPFTLWHSIYT